MRNLDVSCCFRLADAERDQLAKMLEPLEYHPSGEDCYVNELRCRAMSVLPRHIVEVLLRQRSSIAPLPYLVFDNLPVDVRVFTTLGEDRGDLKSGFVSENLIVAFASLLGEPYSIAFEGEGVVNDLIPKDEARMDYTGLGSDVELSFHIENAALKFTQGGGFSPTGLLLTGVRADPQGPLTRLADARRALSRMDEGDRACLRAPHYLIKVPYRWRGHGEVETDPVPMVTGDPELPDVSAVFYPDMVEPLTISARDALVKFREAVNCVSCGVDITPGRLVYIDNRMTLHARDAFRGSLDVYGNPMRWVQRTFVSPSLWMHRCLEPVKARVFMPRCLS